jgi:hypothetical protein
MGDAGAAPGTISPESTSNIQTMRELNEPARGFVLGAYTDALTDLFLFAVPFVIVALLIALLLKEIPLRTATPASTDDAEATMPAMGH